MAQKDLGEKVGVAHNTISSYEFGTNDLFPPTKKGDKRGYEFELLAAHIDDVTENQMDDILQHIDFINSQNKQVSF